MGSTESAILNESKIIPEWRERIWFREHNGWELYIVVVLGCDAAARQPLALPSAWLTSKAVLDALGW